MCLFNPDVPRLGNKSLYTFGFPRAYALNMMCFLGICGQDIFGPFMSPLNLDFAQSKINGDDDVKFRL
jgi:hypothetical protein